MIVVALLLLFFSTSDADLAPPGFRRTAWLHGSATVGPHIQTGVVPIFDKRNTQEPITFTFTTPLPRLPLPQALPLSSAVPPPLPSSVWHPSSIPGPLPLRPADQFEAPYARPTPLKMNSYKPSFQASFAQQPAPFINENYQIPSSISARSAYLPPSPSARFIPSPSLPSSIPSTPFNPSSGQFDMFGREIDGVRHNALQSWTQLKGAVAEAGVDRDWRALWTKMSGVVEPYVEKMTQHLGSAINIALRQQNTRRMRTTPSPYIYYGNNQQQRVKRT